MRVCIPLSKYLVKVGIIENLFDCVGLLRHEIMDKLEHEMQINTIDKLLLDVITKLCSFGK